jgi:hypothetical protein
MADFFITRNSFLWLGLAIIAGMLNAPVFGDTIQAISGTGGGDPFAGAIMLQLDEATEGFSSEYINTTGETAELITPFFSIINTNGADIHAYAGTDPAIAENQVVQMMFTGAYGVGVPKAAPEPSPIVLGGFALILFLSMKRRSWGVSVRIT